MGILHPGYGVYIVDASLAIADVSVSNAGEVDVGHHRIDLRHESGSPLDSLRPGNAI